MSRALSAFGVTHPGADHAIFSAIAVTLFARGVLRTRQRSGLRPAIRPARIASVDRQRRAGAAKHGDDLAVAALALRLGAQRSRLGRIVVERIAERAALSGRERAGRIRLNG